MLKTLLARMSRDHRLFFLLTCWTVVIITSVVYHYTVRQQNLIQLAYVQARAFYIENIEFRNWAASQGGIYLPVSSKVSPNPYLSILNERDIETPQGRALTLANPAYMARLVHEFSAEQNNTHIVHITSLTPIRPENRADAWEIKALRSFAGGEKEVSGVAEFRGRPYFRFMRPMKTVQSCLTCHAFQGYELGDIRGGLSISLPMEEFASDLKPGLTVIAVIHFCLWLAGLAGLLLMPNRKQIEVTGRDRMRQAAGNGKKEVIVRESDPIPNLPHPWKLFFSLFIPLFLLSSLIVLGILYQDSTSEQTLLEQQQSQFVKSRQEIISLDLQGVVADLKVLSSFPELHTLLDNPDSSDVRTAVEKVFLAVSVNKGIYDQIRFLSADGQERVRVDYKSGMPAIVAEDKLQNKKDRYYFADTIALNKGEIFVSPMDLNIERGKIEMPLKPMMRLGMPVYDRDNKKRGILLLNYLSEQLIYDLVRRYSMKTGHLMLMNVEGHWLKGEKPEDEWGFMFPERKERSFTNRYPAAWQKINAGIAGQFYGEEGLYSFATIFPLEESLKSSTGSPDPFKPSQYQVNAREYYWKLVTLVDSAEVKQVMYGNSFKWIPVYVFMLLLFGYSSWRLAVSRQQREAAASELTARNQELEQTIQEVKRLQGILPICSFCKQIRDDEGYWQEVDCYINEHSEVQFSHSVCPACTKEHYPEYYESLGEDE